jgi:hypothetical protein
MVWPAQSLRAGSGASDAEGRSGCRGVQCRAQRRAEVYCTLALLVAAQVLSAGGAGGGGGLAGAVARRSSGLAVGRGSGAWVGTGQAQVQVRLGAGWGGSGRARTSSCRATCLGRPALPARSVDRPGPRRTAVATLFCVQALASALLGDLYSAAAAAGVDPWAPAAAGTPGSAAASGPGVYLTAVTPRRLKFRRGAALLTEFFPSVSLREALNRRLLRVPGAAWGGAVRCDPRAAADKGSGRHAVPRSAAAQCCVACRI